MLISPSTMFLFHVMILGFFIFLFQQHAETLKQLGPRISDMLIVEWVCEALRSIPCNSQKKWGFIFIIWWLAFFSQFCSKDISMHIYYCIYQSSHVLVKKILFIQAFTIKNHQYHLVLPVLVIPSTSSTSKPFQDNPGAQSQELALSIGRYSSKLPNTKKNVYACGTFCNAYFLEDVVQNRIIFLIIPLFKHSSYNNIHSCVSVMSVLLPHKRNFSAHQCPHFSPPTTLACLWDRYSISISLSLSLSW